VHGLSDWYEICLFPGMRCDFIAHTVFSGQLYRLGWLIWCATLIVGCSSKEPEPAGQPRVSEPPVNTSFVAVQPPFPPTTRTWQQQPYAQPERYSFPQPNPNQTYQPLPRYRPDSGRQSTNPWVSPNQQTGWPDGAPPNWRNAGNPWGGGLYGPEAQRYRYRTLDSNVTESQRVFPEPTSPGRYAGAPPPASETGRTAWPSEGDNRWSDRSHPQHRPAPITDREPLNRMAPLHR